MPDEIFALTIISMIAGTGLVFFLIWIISEHVKARRELGSSNSSMTTSELEKMIEQAALKAVRPMQRRLENLESAFVDHPSTELIGSQRDDLLAGSDAYTESDPELDEIKVTRGIASLS